MPVARNLISKDLHSDPYPVYRELRDHEPWAWSDGLGMWLVSRYEDVVFVDEHPEIFTAHQKNSLAERTMGLVMIRTDGDAHRRLRSSVDGPLKRRNVRQQWSAGLTSSATQLAERLAETPEFDLVKDFAAPFAAQALMTTTGLAGVTTKQVVEWSGAFIAGLANHENSPVVWERAGRARAEVGERVRQAVARVKATPDHTVISAMVHADIAEPLTDEEIATQVRLMISGGFNEPWHALATLVWQLCARVELRDRVLADPDALDAAIEETMRWLSPIGAFPRQLAVDHTAGDVTLRAGDKLLALAASANRDERKFADPDTFDIDRPDLPDHLAFSLGAHYCLGTYLAREQLRTAVPALFTSLTGLRVTRTPNLVGWMFRGPESVDMRHDVRRAKGADR
ncbi:cytochrome P450 [Streptomyces sp. NPDC051018]|uniref:cytochrome P450 n=1 Tax=Streptomyces sp. NPDC051018 TaxID=3365639 RepID=UPI003787F124